MMHWQLLGIVGVVGMFGIACFVWAESIRVRVVRWKMRAEIDEAAREVFSELR